MPIPFGSPELQKAKPAVKIPSRDQIKYFVTFEEKEGQKPKCLQQDSQRGRHMQKDADAGCKNNHILD